MTQFISRVTPNANLLQPFCTFALRLPFPRPKFRTEVACNGEELTAPNITGRNGTHLFRATHLLYLHIGRVFKLGMFFILKDKKTQIAPSIFYIKVKDGTAIRDEYFHVCQDKGIPRQLTTSPRLLCRLPTYCLEFTRTYTNDSAYAPLLYWPFRLRSTSNLSTFCNQNVLPPQSSQLSFRVATQGVMRWLWSGWWFTSPPI